MTPLIFGANGQDGYYLSDLCRLKGIEPIGVLRSGDWAYVDVSKYEQVDQLVCYDSFAGLFVSGSS